MRLKKVANEYDRGTLPGGTTDRDIHKLFHYRKELFGLPFSRAAEAIMRGPSAWSVGERELMAAYVSRQNRCRF